MAPCDALRFLRDHGAARRLEIGHDRRRHMRSLRRRAADAGKNLLATAKCDPAPLMQHNRHIQRTERARTVRDDYDDALVLAQNLDGATESVLTLGIEIGVRLIKHDEEGVAVDGA